MKITSPNRYSVILGNLGNTCDRFLPTGYKEARPKREMLREAASIPGIEGVELVGTWDIREDNTRSLFAETLGPRQLEREGPRHPPTGSR